jgi:hypothetical protein
MRAANRALLLGLLLASAACRQAPADENVAFDNQAGTTTDIEALPPDESAATTEELINGADQTSNADAAANVD